MQFNVGDEVEIVRLTIDAGEMFNIGTITRIQDIKTYVHQPYNLECSNPRGWWVDGCCIQLINISLENV